MSRSRSLPDAVEQLERWLIEEAPQNSGGNEQKAAQVLGPSRQGLIKKLKRFPDRPKNKPDLGFVTESGR